MTALTRWLSRRSAAQVTAIGLAAIAVIGFLDHLTGYELSFSIFYLLPVALVTWFSWRWAAIGACVVSAIVWLVVDYTAGHSYSHWLIPYWNAAVRLGFFGLTSYLLAQLKSQLAAQERLASIDALTGIPNGSTFRKLASRLLKIAARHDHCFALGFIDLDNFKQVNDTLGHAAGDRVLKSVAGTIVGCLRSTDVVGRLGGDEFAVLVPEASAASAQAAFARLHQALMIKAAAADWPIGFSIGVAVYPRAPENIDDALKCADDLMYRIKRGGKNRVVCEVQTAIEQLPNALAETSPSSS